MASSLEPKIRNRAVTVAGKSVANDKPLFLIAGPCAIESEELVLSMAAKLSALARKLGLTYVFKSSYDKANRSSASSFRGPGLEKGLRILRRVKEEIGCAILTDVHWKEDVAAVAKVVDIIQIPAFLCRQTDLLLACGDSGKIVNVKKGQFMAPWDMGNAVKKIESTGNRQILLTERGISFGYNNLVVDMRGIAVMREFGYPVIYDATHSVQLPGGLGHASGGQRQFVYPLCKSAVALGIAGLFCEVHPNPDKALSDGPNSLKLSDMPVFLTAMKKLDRTVKSL
jgi:2-dehydro-3-deoxyphosphooctonate aldolase (KDO 8-P synthase)